MKQTQCDRTMHITSIYERHFETIWNICFTFLKNPADTEDAVQETFVRLLSHQIAFSSEEHEKAWLIVVAQNVCKNELRRARRREVSLEAVLEPCEGEFVIDETLSAVMALPDRYKVPIYLHYYEGYTATEIAKMLKKPASTIRSDLRRGRLQMRRELGGAF